MNIQKWEYFQHNNVSTLPRRINELGNEGWELVSVVASVVEGDNVLVFYFKRPIQEPSSEGAFRRMNE